MEEKRGNRLIKKGEAYFGQAYFSDPQQGWLLSPAKLYRTQEGSRTWQVARRLMLPAF